MGGLKVTSSPRSRLPHPSTPSISDGSSFAERLTLVDTWVAGRCVGAVARVERGSHARQKAGLRAACVMGIRTTVGRIMVEATRLFLSDVQVAARYAVSRTTIWRWSKETDFPDPVRLGPGTTRWRLSELEDWERKRQPTR